MSNAETHKHIELDPSQFLVREEVDQTGSKKIMLSVYLSSIQARKAQGLLKISQKPSGDYSVGYVVDPDLEQFNPNNLTKSIAKKSKTNYQVIRELTNLR